MPFVGRSSPVLLNCVLIYALCAKWYSARIGLIAAIVSVVMAPYPDGEALPATLATFLNLCSFYCLTDLCTKTVVSTFGQAASLLA